MTLLAGMFALSDETSITDAACDSLRGAISRDPEDHVVEFRDHRSYLAKVDIGAYGEPAVVVDGSGAISMLAGAPLLDAGRETGRHRSRAEDLEEMHRHWVRSDWRVLAKTRGHFAAVHYNPSSGSLSLMVDQLGVRPLYYWVGHDVVVFATALRILEAVPEVTKVMDLQGITELIYFTYALADRTPYANTRQLRPAELVRFVDTARTERYRRWDQVKPATQPESELLRRAHDQFMKAVDRRLGGQQTAQVSLSGGLDSRCIVVALRDLGANVYTYNFSYPNTYDEILSAQCAERFGTLHYHEQMPYDAPFSQSNSRDARLGALLKTRDLGSGPVPERRQLAWFGYGGGDVVGHIFQTQEIVDLLRARRFDEVADRNVAMRKGHLPKAVLNPALAGTLSAFPRRSVSEALQRIECPDLGHAMSIFEIMEYERRHLVDAYEDIDLNRLDFHTPFFDSDFVTFMFSVPIELGLKHKFYNKWLKEFPDMITSVAWQTYPGQEKCPLPLPTGYQSQWQSFGKTASRLRKQVAIERVSKILNARDFPHPILRKGRLRLSKWITMMELDRLDYIFKIAETYYKYWRTCEGRYVISG